MPAPRPPLSKQSFILAAVSALAGLGLGVVLTLQFTPAPPPVSAPPPQEEEAPPSPPVAVVYDEVVHSDLPGWSSDSLIEALPALKRSCGRFERMGAEETIGTGQIERTAAAWSAACAALDGANDNESLRAVLDSHFTAYSISDTSKETAPDLGTFTGYYEADIKGSLTRTGPYQTPIYGPPRDLVTVNLKDFISNTSAFDLGVPDSLVGRVEPGARGGLFRSYYTREDIDSSGAIANEADVVVWADDPVDVHILHIQGSGRVVLPDGHVIRIGFAGHNGHSFRGIGGILLRAGELKPGQGSMISVRKWLQAHPQKAEAYMNQNARYIFFRRLNPSETESGPIGALGVSLTPQRSLAVDPRFVPLGAPVWIDASDPDGIPLQRLMSAQDIGSAIKGPVRGDFFWGHGEEAFSKAGRMKSDGRLFVLVPKLV